MCGIAGEIRFDGQLADSAAVATITRHQARRGPDNEGLYAHGARAFGHRRLRIMDLSEKAHQPFFDSALGLGIVFNGAIYNHHELRAELTDRGYQFSSTGDTEVIIKSWHAWGEDALQKFHGMFAFAIWERDSGRTWLVRDRLGIKPLYYSVDSKRLRFASTLPALLAGGGIDTRLNPIALHHYLSFHAVVPAPHTLLNGVQKLAPGMLMRIDADGSRHERRYWQLSFHHSVDDERCSFDDWRERTLHALRAAVRRRQVADVPVGVLLSGGLDSSLITGLLAEHGGAGLRTYSIGFETVNGESGDEFQYSRLIARHYGTEHTELFIPAQGLLQRLPEAIQAMSEPMVSHDCIGFYLLSESVSRHTRVVQSGQGADEVFAGYHWYPPMLDSIDPVRDYLRVFADRDHNEMASVLRSDWLQDDYSFGFVAEQFGLPVAIEPVDKALRLDTTVMLVDDPVKRVDNMTMAFGLEARVPFLDHELVELAARIPARHKVKQGGKHVLKEAARQVIPAEVIDRPKGYFPVPALKYLQGDLLSQARDWLTDPGARTRDVLRADYVQKLLAAPDAHITPLRGSKLWQLALLEAWLRCHVR